MRRRPCAESYAASPRRPSSDRFERLLDTKRCRVPAAAKGGDLAPRPLARIPALRSRCWP